MGELYDPVDQGSETVSAIKLGARNGEAAADAVEDAVTAGGPDVTHAIDLHGGQRNALPLHLEAGKHGLPTGVRLPKGGRQRVWLEPDGEEEGSAGSRAGGRT